MFLDLKSCYSPSDIIFIVSLFILVSFCIGSFSTIIAHLVKSVINEVRYIKSKNNEN